MYVAYAAPVDFLSFLVATPLHPRFAVRGNVPSSLAIAAKIIILKNAAVLARRP